MRHRSPLGPVAVSDDVLDLWADASRLAWEMWTTRTDWPDLAGLSKEQVEGCAYYAWQDAVADLTEEWATGCPWLPNELKTLGESWAQQALVIVESLRRTR